MLLGNCLCGTIRWQYDGAFDLMTHCHCGMCRKAHGTAFATYVMGTRAPFAYVAGEEAIVRFESSPGFIRSFCKFCGSVLPNPHLGERMAAPAGGFDGDLGVTSAGHIFAKWKAPWYTITDGLPQHDNYPGASAPAVEHASDASSKSDVLRGSCLCGDVGYDVLGGFKAVHNCHCSRCRKARAAAHCTNGLTAVDNLHFIRGENQLVTYHLPDARFFSQVFCARCGSPMPRIDHDRNFTIVPFGSLDDDPKRGGDDHIFVGSKSGWYPITDSLPQFEGPPR
ncbi:MAG: GFA family protein [Gammaproteobacteria bacterium]|nr:GFA family protein [Gammaproteobacteria bacterium]